MAGHSKFKNIMHRKGAQDKKRSAMFSKLSREITVAAKMGMPDPDMNPRLRLAVNAAKAQSMPKDNIQRAIDKAIGGDMENYEEIRYEGYGPGGVAIIVEALTDNRNRTASDVRNAFTKFGGSLAEPGAVSWQFARRGLIVVSGSVEEDTVMTAALEAGADDIERDGDTWRVLTDSSVVYEVKEALEAASIEVLSAESTMVSANTIEVTDLDDARQILRIMDMLDESDDVQDVYANFDIEESLMQEIE